MFEINVYPGQSIQAVLDRLPDGPAWIHLAEGTYREKIRIQRNDVTLKGSGVSTVIVFDDAANKIHADGTPFVTFRTPTVTVIADRVRFLNLTVGNDAGLGKDVGQAVALSVYGADFLAEGCRFFAHQDTLFLGPLPVDLTKRYEHFLPKEELHTTPRTHRFVDCLIEGDVDFIFGSATALFWRCTIELLGEGYLAAPSTYATTSLGLCFVECVICSKDPAARPYLARPWREEGSAVFQDCRFDGSFHPDRFHDWQKASYRFLETPYVKSDCSDPIDDVTKEALKSLLNQ